MLGNHGYDVIMKGNDTYSTVNITGGAGDDVVYNGQNALYYEDSEGNYNYLEDTASKVNSFSWSPLSPICVCKMKPLLTNPLRKDEQKLHCSKESTRRHFSKRSYRSEEKFQCLLGKS